MGTTRKGSCKGSIRDLKGCRAKGLELRVLAASAGACLTGFLCLKGVGF